MLHDNTYVARMTVTTTGETSAPDTTLLRDSLRRRMRAMHSLYADAVATMTLDHVNHFEREGVLPIAFSLFHYTNMQDVSFAVISGEPVLWDAYSARVAGPEGITVLDALECWIYQHGLRHMGEIELARGLVGLGGMTS
jgi:hypothetical protein